MPFFANKKGLFQTCFAFVASVNTNISVISRQAQRLFNLKIYLEVYCVCVMLFFLLLPLLEAKPRPHTCTRGLPAGHFWWLGSLARQCVGVVSRLQRWSDKPIQMTAHVNVCKGRVVQIDVYEDQRAEVLGITEM